VVRSGVADRLGDHVEAEPQQRGAAPASQGAAATGARGDWVTAHERSAREHVFQPDRSRRRRGFGRFALAAALLLALDGAPLGEALKAR